MSNQWQKRGTRTQVSCSPCRFPAADTAWPDHWLASPALSQQSLCGKPPVKTLSAGVLPSLVSKCKVFLFLLADGTSKSRNHSESRDYKEQQADARWCSSDRIGGSVSLSVQRGCVCCHGPTASLVQWTVSKVLLSLLGLSRAPWAA